jgi:hypothetical protein
MTHYLLRLGAAGFLVVLLAFPATAYVAYDSHLLFLDTLTKDLLKLLPRAMGSYIYQNRYDFTRGMTFMTRDILFNPAKMKDVEEIKHQTYERLMRDIPYCVQAFKGGDIKLDTSQNNLSGRLGMIAYSILLAKLPEFPDLEYLERFTRTFDEAIGESAIDVWVYYDGYADFNSLGELMERLRPYEVPSIVNMRNDTREIRDMSIRPFVGSYKEDTYVMFRAPEKFIPHLVITRRDINSIYSEIVNCIADTYVFIWKSSGMDLAHPSHAAPPGTVIDRGSRRRILPGGALTRLPIHPSEEAGEEGAPPLEEEESGGEESAPAPAPLSPPILPPGPQPPVLPTP